MNSTKKPTAYSYIRFSTPEQLKGDSLDRQTRNAKLFAEKNGLFLDEKLTFKDLGISSWNSQNQSEGELGDFLAAIQTGRIAHGSYLLVEAVDRLTRAGPVDAIPLLMQITNAGINVAILSKDKVISREILKKNPFIFFEILSDAILANQESNQKSERVGSAWAKKRKLASETQKPMTKRCPAWLRLSEDRTKYEVIRDRAALVVRIFRMSANKMGKRTIAIQLNREGIETWGDGIHQSRRANGWHDSYIAKILDSEAVRGIYQPHRREPVTKKRYPDGNPIEGYFPKILSNALWTNARTRKSGPRGPRSVRIANLFSGIIYDGYTGATMRFVDKGRADGKNHDWRYLVSDSKRLNPDTANHNWPYSIFEGWVLNHLRNLDWASIEGAESDAETSRLQYLEAHLIAETDKLKEEMNMLITSFVNSPEALRKAVEDNANRKALELEAAQTELERIRAKIEELNRSRNALRSGYEGIRVLISRGDLESRIKLQSEIRNRVKSIHLFRHGHPRFEVKWPAVVITYTNGSPHISMVNNLFSKQVHHSRRQVRDSQTGAFRKLKPGETAFASPKIENPDKPKVIPKKTIPNPKATPWTREEMERKRAYFLPPWPPEIWSQNPISSKNSPMAACFPDNSADDATAEH